MSHEEKESQKVNPVKTRNKRLLLFFGLLAVVLIAATAVFAKDKTVIVEATVLNVRAGPGLSYDVMTQVVEKDELKVLEEKNDWFKVRLTNDKIGWVASWLVKNTEVAATTTYVGIIVGDEANIRKQANTTSDILGTVSEGTELNVLYSQDNWIQVDYYGQVAWISKELIQVTDRTPEEKPEMSLTETDPLSTKDTVTIKTDGTNIRTGPSTTHESLHQANQGDVYEYISSEGDWYVISLSDGETGYIANWTVTLSSPSSIPESVVQTTSLSEATIVIDAGHGGKDPGASKNNLIEKELTLKTAELLAQKLRSYGTNVIMTRNGDQSVSLNDRVYISHQANADAFISIHYDAFEETDSISGTSTFYYSEKDQDLAEQINKFLKANGPLKNNGVKKGNFLVLRENQQPAILLELGYINSTIDGSIIQSDSYRSNVTDQIVQALLQFYTN